MRCWQLARSLPPGRRRGLVERAAVSPPAATLKVPTELGQCGVAEGAARVDYQTPRARDMHAKSAAVALNDTPGGTCAVRAKIAGATCGPLRLVHLFDLLSRVKPILNGTDHVLIGRYAIREERNEKRVSVDGGAGGRAPRWRTALSTRSPRCRLPVSARSRRPLPA